MACCAATTAWPQTLEQGAFAQRLSAGGGSLPTGWARCSRTIAALKARNVQGLHRKANTLGSKSATLELTTIAVDMKVLIEQLREQVQNIE